jgi:hypothetical protein
MPTPIISKATHINLQSHPGFSEAWLEDLIVEDPAMLGLGDVAVVDRQRRQPKAGRLDLLLEDAGSDRRFEVELMLGKTDESHVIRVIEYWDAERRRYPGYDHVAVLVAEDITSRFLNVLTLFAGTIPLVALQLTALQVGDQMVLHFVRVIDQTQLRLDDTSAAELAVTDRAFWENRATSRTVAMADKLLPWINDAARDDYQLNYNKHYIGLSNGVRSTNFIILRPRKSHMVIGILLEDPEAWAARADEAGLSADAKKGRTRLNLNPADISKHESMIKDMIAAAAQRAEGE